ncbi:MAG: hypothetical protein ACC726_09795 [Chloroflexota bacterium]
MRKSMTTLTTIIAIGLLAGSALGVAAQDAEVPSGLLPATVSGTMDALGGSETVGTPVDGLQQDQQTEAGRLEMSDPRLSGSYSIKATMNRYLHRDEEVGAEVWSGTATVTNDGGAWIGTVIGCSSCNTDETHVPDTTYIELVGTDGYEGLSAILFVEPVPWEGFMQPLVTYGVIFPGDVPSP